MGKEEQKRRIKDLTDIIENVKKGKEKRERKGSRKCIPNVSASA